MSTTTVSSQMVDLSTSLRVSDLSGLQGGKEERGEEGLFIHVLYCEKLLYLKETLKSGPTLKNKTKK